MLVALGGKRFSFVSARKEIGWRGTYCDCGTRETVRDIGSGREFSE